ncbi:MAG: ribonuclease P protein component [Ruminococcus sp.]|nr:ribonuclease P protein component [Ruminococcus sp.]
MLFTEILKDNKIFLRCFKKGSFVSCEYLTAYFISNKSPYNRLGISVGKKQGNAVKRNRIKRIIRAAYRLNEEKIPIGYDIVFVGRNNISEKKMQDIEYFIKKRLIKKINDVNNSEKQKR